MSTYINVLVIVSLFAIVTASTNGLTTATLNVFPPAKGPDLERLLAAAEQTASPLTVLNHSWIVFRNYAMDWERFPYNANFTHRAFSEGRPCLWKTLFICFTAIMFTLLRVSTAASFKVALLRLGVSSADAAKVPESFWKACFYTVLWLYTFYTLLLSGNYDYVKHPCNIWRDHIFDDEYFQHPIPWDIGSIYWLQCSFYLYSIFATTRLDVWRTDSALMLVHHFVTLALIGISYTVRYHKFGTVVLLLHDFSDVFLELAKMNIYMKSRGSLYRKMHNALANFCFAVFVLSWAYLRLYLYPLKVIYAGNWCAYLHGVEPKYYIVLNILVWSLFFMHVYWFWNISIVVVNIFTGKITEVEDIRETEVNTEPKSKTGNGVDANGFVANGIAPPSTSAVDPCKQD